MSSIKRICKCGHDVFIRVSRFYHKCVECGRMVRDTAEVVKVALEVGTAFAAMWKAAGSNKT